MANKLNKRVSILSNHTLRMILKADRPKDKELRKAAWGEMVRRGVRG